MKKVILSILAAAAVALPAIAKDEVDVKWNYDTSEARMLNSDAKLFVRPFVVDLELVVKPTANEKAAKRITWESTISGEKYLSLAAYDNKGGMLIEETAANMKSHVVYLASTGALKPTNSDMLTFDILVAPLFDMSFDQSGCTIRFTGYPARYTNWQAATGEQFNEFIRSGENGKTESKQSIRGEVGTNEVSIREEKAASVRSLIGK